MRVSELDLKHSFSLSLDSIGMTVTGLEILFFFFSNSFRTVVSELEILFVFKLFQDNTAQA